MSSSTAATATAASAAAAAATIATSTSPTIVSVTATSPLPGAIAKHPWHADYNPSLENQTFIHNDDNNNTKRTTGFAEYGSPTGVPAFLFHGAPGSRYDGIVYHSAAKKLDVRIICPDRPGHGLSTFVPGRKLTDYPSDVSALARHLKLGPYHVFGQSGGGPYAVACARFTPRDESLNVGVVAGMGPPETVTLRMAGWYTVIALWLHRNVPGLLRRVVEWQYPVKSIQDDEKLQKIIENTMKWLPAETREEMKALDNNDRSEEELERELRVHLQCMFAQGFEGTFRDAQIYGAPWEFRLEDVERKVLLIYGGKDVRTPVAFGRWYKEHLQDAELVEFEGDGHLSISDKADEILARLVGREDVLERLKREEAEKEKAKDREGSGEVEGAQVKISPQE